MWMLPRRSGNLEGSHKSCCPRQQHQEHYVDQGGALGAPRTRPEIEEGDAHLQPRNKRIVFQVPSFEQCLGIEGL
jgi:hypothetical protein